jgi:hypothetical protein
LPGVVQCRATLGILLGAILITCPSNLIRLWFISPTMFLHLLFLSIVILCPYLIFRNFIKWPKLLNCMPIVNKV